jgi:hypothetical protein
MRLAEVEKVSSSGDQIETEEAAVLVRTGDAVGSVPPAGGTLPVDKHF